MPPIRKDRNQAIEALRIVAAYGIIAYHAGTPFASVAYSGLIIFVILSPMLDTEYNWGRLRTVQAMAITLLLPWAFWTLVYGIKNVVTHKPLLPYGNTVGGLLYGTSEHLWFLPFMFGVLLVLNALKSIAAPTGLFWSCTVAGVILLLTASSWLPAAMALPCPLPQWSHAALAVLVGIVYGLRGHVGRAALLAYGALGAALIVALAMHAPGVGLTYLVGIVVTGIVDALPRRFYPANFNVQGIAACMFGVYLTHMLWLKPFSRLTGEGNYLTVTLAFAAALLAVFIVRRTVPASRLVLG